MIGGLIKNSAIVTPRSMISPRLRQPGYAPPTTPCIKLAEPTMPYASLLRPDLHQLVGFLRKTMHPGAGCAQARTLDSHLPVMAASTLQGSDRDSQFIDIKGILQFV